MPWMSFQVNCELFRLLAYSGIPYMGCLTLSHFMATIHVAYTYLYA
jgi:hypothetical protein